MKGVIWIQYSILNFETIDFWTFDDPFSVACDWLDI